MSIGPVVGGFLVALDFILLFYVNGFTTILDGVFLIVYTNDIVHDSKHEIQTEKIVEKATEQLDETRNKKSKSLFKDTPFIFYMLALIPVKLVFFQLLGGMPLYIVRDLKFVESTFGILIAINTLLIILVLCQSSIDG